MLRIISFFLFTTTLYATTEFLFIRENNKNPRGKCYEVDSKSKGQNFKAKVSIENCKPKKTYHFFNSGNGKCYLVDEETGGYNYIQLAKGTDNCKTSNISVGILKINKISACYEYDTKSAGKEYFKKLSAKKCLAASDEFVWVSKKKLQGDCFQKGAESNGSPLSKVKKKYCRPMKVAHLFSKNSSSFFKGKCYEVHPEDPKNYSKVVKPENCKPRNTVYIFYTPEGKKDGKCFEIDALTKGEKYIDTVSDELCKENL
jgi:hypothetical protein